jgi:L-rhamnose mutarotase
MQRVGFTMKLHYGCAAEYRKRHDAIWPELKAVLTETGISDYSIFLDADTNTLFAYLKIPDRNSLHRLSEHPVMHKWWNFMKDIMDTNEDASPVVKDLDEVFFLE